MNLIIKENKEELKKWTEQFHGSKYSYRIPTIASHWAIVLKTLTTEMNACLDFALDQSVMVMKGLPLCASDAELDLAIEGVAIGYFGDDLRREWKSRKLALHTERPPPMTGRSIEWIAIDEEMMGK